MKNDEETQHNYDAVIRRVEKNGTSYTVRLERWLLGRDNRLKNEDGQPSGRPMPGTRLDVLPIDKSIVQTPNLPDAITGVILTDYHVQRDDDPSWQAWVTLDGDPVYGNESWAEDAHLFIARVEIQRGRRNLDSSTLPLADILRACVKCGHVALEREGDSWRLVYDDNGLPMPAAQYDRLIRRRPKAAARHIDDAEILRLCDEHAAERDKYRRGELDKDGKPWPDPERQRDYVGKKLGYSSNYAAELIKNARRRAGLTTTKKAGN